MVVKSELFCTTLVLLGTAVLLVQHAQKERKEGKVRRRVEMDQRSLDSMDLSGQKHMSGIRSTSVILMP